MYHSNITHKNYYTSILAVKVCAFGVHPTVYSCQHQIIEVLSELIQFNLSKLVVYTNLTSTYLLRQLISLFSYGVAVFDELPPVIPIMHHPKIQLFLLYICCYTILPPGLRSSSPPTSLHLHVLLSTPSSSLLSM